nr:MAG TPA: hypothetical protein [Bacteriophage sp.]
MTGFTIRHLNKTYFPNKERADGVHEIGGFAEEDYISFCNKENITIPMFARLFMFIIEEQDTEEEIEALIRALNRIDLSMLCIQYGTTAEWDKIGGYEAYQAKVVDKMWAIDTMLKDYGFDATPCFKDTYETRIVYIGNSTDARKVKVCANG